MIDLPSPTLLDDAESLRDRIILITGGAAGFGLGAATLAVEYGAKVVIADLKLSLTQKAVSQLRHSGGTATAPENPVDVTKPESLQAAFEHSVKEYGKPPDIVFANAGVSLDDHFEEDGEVIAHPRPPRNLTLAVNLTGVLNTCKIAQEFWKQHPVPAKEGRKRRLVILSSMGGMTGIPGGTAYSTSKHAVLAYWKGITRQLEVEGPEAGFECYAICPFFANTRIINPATLGILSGLPLVPVLLIAHTMLHVASKPIDPGSPPGGVVIIPDDGDPAIATASEYDPLSPAWGAKMDERCQRADKSSGWLEVAPSVRIWRDIARNLFKTSPNGLATRLIFILLVLTGAVLAFIQGLRILPTWVTVLLGISLGSLARLRGTRALR